MNSRVAMESGAAPDPKKLKYLTENFFALQGSSAVPFGLVLAAWEMTTEFLTSHRRWVFFLFLMAWAVAFYFGLILGPRYYRSRFGLVQRQPNTALDLSTKQIVYLCLGGALVLIVGDVTNYLIHAPVDTHSLWAWLGGTIFIAMFYRRLPLMQGIGSRRLTYLFPLWAAYPLLTLYLIVHPLDAGSLAVWKVIHAGYLGMAILIVGVCDHILLIGLLSKGFEESDGE